MEAERFDLSLEVMCLAQVGTLIRTPNPVSLHYNNSAFKCILTKDRKVKQRNFERVNVYLSDRSSMKLVGWREVLEIQKNL